MAGYRLSNTYRRSEIMGNITKKVKDVVRGWLDINPSEKRNYAITESFNFETNAIKNRIWMRGDPEELDEFYKQLPRDNSYFWKASPRTKIRKIHTGLPSLMVQVLTDVVVRDMNSIDSGSRKLDWDEIAKDNDFSSIMRKAVKEALFIGDGAFKITFNRSISEYPIIEFVAGDKIDLIYNCGRFVECIFKTEYKHDNRRYVHYEHYGYGYIKNVLKKWDGDESIALDTIPQTAMLRDYGFAGYVESDGHTETIPGRFCMAVPFKVRDSTKWECRGESIFDKKISAFDAFDEIVSQWADAVRAGRAKQYIPETLLPRSPETGEMLNYNQYDDRYLMIEGNMGEKSDNKIEVTQPVIPSESYMQAYISFLDQALQGVISPSTLGIDTKKLDNAEAQREKEKTTLYTRGIIVDAIQNTIPTLVNSVLRAYDEFTKQSSGEDIEVNVAFGEYASPSFEAVIETLAKARPGCVIMSIEASIDEMYGNSKDDDWKALEVKRLKEELEDSTALEETTGMFEEDV